MDSKGTKTSVRETSAEAASVWEGDTSSSVALRLGWELGTGAGGSAVKAGIGFGATFVPVLFWRSLRVGLDCCLSLREEEWATLRQLLLWALKWFWSAFSRNGSLTNSWLNVDAVQTTKLQKYYGHLEAFSYEFSKNVIVLKSCQVPFDLQALWR